MKLHTIMHAHVLSGAGASTAHRSAIVLLLSVTRQAQLCSAVQQQQLHATHSLTTLWKHNQWYTHACPLLCRGMLHTWFRLPEPSQPSLRSLSTA